MPNTFINERHRKYSEACQKAIEETSRQPYSAEDMIERCLRNLGIEESMVETAYLMEQPDLVQAIRKGEEDLKNGNTSTAHASYKGGIYSINNNK